MPRALAALALLVSGCIAKWDTSAPGIALDGPVPTSASLPRLNVMPAGSASLLRGNDGAPWTGFCEFSSSSPLAKRNTCKRMHLVRLDGAAGDEVIEADDFAVRYTALYVGRDTPSGASLDPPLARTLTIHRPGDAPATDVTISVPVGKALLYINDGGDDDVFVYWILAPSTTHFDLYRRDGKHHRQLPVPAGVDPVHPQSSTGFDFLLTSDGSALVLREPGGTMTAYSTLADTAVALGPRPPDFLLDDPRRAVLTVGADGFRSFPLAGATDGDVLGHDRVLDPSGFDPATLRIQGGADAYFARGGDLFVVPLDGSAAAKVAQSGAARLLAVGPAGQIVSSHDLADRFAGGAGDGWLGDWNFMERGRKLAFSGDGARIRFLEHAATLGTVGDLTSVEIASPGAAPLTLGLNVHAFDELADGRVLAIENRVAAGEWNRLVVIDEQALTKKWVVPSATDFLLTPDHRGIIADVITGASGYDIVRAPPP